MLPSSKRVPYETEVADVACFVDVATPRTTGVGRRTRVIRRAPQAPGAEGSRHSTTSHKILACDPTPCLRRDLHLPTRVTLSVREWIWPLHWPQGFSQIGPSIYDLTLTR